MLFRVNFIKFLTKASASQTTRCLSTVTKTGISSHVPPPASLLLFSNNPWIWQKPEPIQLPITNIKPITLPDNLIRITSIIEPNNNNAIDKIIEDPLTINNDGKEAARLIVIRRKKMKKHKLKKLRKRMKYEWAKIRQRRELKKEKDFQAALIAKCKEAEGFSAAEYVANKLKQAAEQPPPRFRDTPEFKELMRQKRLRLNINT